MFFWVKSLYQSNAVCTNLRLESSLLQKAERINTRNNTKLPRYLAEGRECSLHRQLDIQVWCILHFMGFTCFSYLSEQSAMCCYFFNDRTICSSLNLAKLIRNINKKICFVLEATSFIQRLYGYYCFTEWSAEPQHDHVLVTCYLVL